MRAAAFRRLVTMDETGLLEKILGFLEDRKVPYCIIGGQAVNGYVEPLESLDLDIAVAVEDPRSLIEELKGLFKVTLQRHIINIEQSGSELRAQIQTDPRYAAFVPAAEQQRGAGPRDASGAAGRCLERENLGGCGSGASQEQTADRPGRYRAHSEVLPAPSGQGT
jgi:hypothetical protein